MKKIVRLTENDLTKLVKRVISEQLLPAPEKKNNKPFWDEYAMRMTNFLKNKMFNTLVYMENDTNQTKPYYPLIKVLGYGDRSHLYDDKSKESVKEWDMMFKVQIIDSKGLPNVKNNQLGYISITFTYKNGRITGIKESTLWDNNVKMIGVMKGWRLDDDFGGEQKWHLIYY